ncbi:3-phosphoshikimate 1-carboxyvinyltransferase [Brumimicrobium mesophilum]|uniref:3-phosphoshikimate 1-carboxyvinyltransferase n=1 Tax=Brumimicrobium mesophilum TaxID=392717 RepID=UPI00131B46D2|nr:3-phosphoshikimate 1-carboxyvinyltransferase [Brumimicrobium mesophilum]
MEILPKKCIEGEINIPSSKSYAQRAIALASLSSSSVVIHNLTNSDDVIAAQGIVKSIGAKFSRNGAELRFLKGINFDSKEEVFINSKESGLSTRLFSAFSLLFEQEFLLNGEGSILQRTMEMVIDGLEPFGKVIKSNELKLPLSISGEVTNLNVEIDGSISSQFLTGLLIVAPFLNSDTRIQVRNLKSKPYIEMTIDLMRFFGLKVEHENFKTFNIKGNQSLDKPINYKVEGDWSAASFHVVAAAIGGKVKLSGLSENSRQGDKSILDAVKLAGARVNWKKGDLYVEKSELNHFEFDATECPDLFPPLAVLAAYCNGRSRIKGVNRLKHKESDRGITLQKEFFKIGVKIELIADEMIIYGNENQSISEEVTFSSHNDHRIAMAMSLFSIAAKSSIFIDSPNAIDKSYPDFYKDFLTI